MPETIVPIRIDQQVYLHHFQTKDEALAFIDWMDALNRMPDAALR